MNKTFLLFLLSLAAFLVPGGSAYAARLALVIGNSSYADSPLKNPVNDARAMEAKLKTLGFDVTKVENLKRRDIGRTLNGFASSVKPGDEVVVFYAGHGLQVKGVNYLPAVDAEIQSEEDAPLNSLNLGTLLDRLDEAKAGVKILFLDACRNNPYARSFRSSARGLARVQDAPSGTLMHFATRPGSVAADGAGANGLYTTELLRHIDQPGMAIEQMLKRVAAAVERESKGQQEPWTEGSLKGDFYFKQSGVAAQQVASVVPEPVTITQPPAQSGGTALDDLKKEEASRKEWAQWQARMKSEYDQVQAFNGSADLQIKAWERFLAAWGQDNPLSNDDESFREQASRTLMLLRVTSSTAGGRIQATASSELIEGRYQPIGDGSEIKDTKTGLIWQRCSVGQKWSVPNGCIGEVQRFSYEDALKVSGDYWRVPSLRELSTLIYCSSGRTDRESDPKDGRGAIGNNCDGGFEKPTIRGVAFPQTPLSRYWTSTPFNIPFRQAWFVSFDDGYINVSGLLDFYGKSFALRLVRGGN